jgi:hypothetical protein
VRTFIVPLLVLASVIAAYGQKKSVVVGTLISRPNAILILNPPGADQGFLLPQLTTSQRLAILPSSPQEDGLMVFDADDKSFYHWKSNAWVKGLGDEAADQLLSYNATTQQLSLSGNGGVVDLSSLKEVPALAGQSGKYLTTDGVTLSWATIAALGDITGIIAGQGLLGGATNGDASLSVHTDGTTIGINGSSQLNLLDGAVTTQKLVDDAITAPKIATDAVNTTHIADGTVTSTDIADNTVTSSDLADASVTGPKIATGVVSSTHIADNTIVAADLTNGAVTPAKVQPGANNQILVTDGTGNTAWVNQTLIPPNVVVDGTTITGNATSGNPLTVGANSITSTHIATDAVGNAELANDAVTAGELADNAVDGAAIQDNAITTTKLAADAVTTTDIQNSAVSPAKIQPGTNNQVLVTNGAGTTAWIDQTLLPSNVVVDGILITGAGTSGNPLTIGSNSLTENQIAPDAITASELANGAVDANAIQAGAVNSGHILDGTVATADLQDNGVTTAKLATDAVATINIQNTAVTPAKIQPGTNNQVLVTDGTGITAWINQNLLPPNVVVDGTTITGNATAGNPLTVGTNSITAAHIAADAVGNSELANDAVGVTELADGSVDANAIQTGVVNSSHILDGTVATADLQDDAITTTKLAPDAVTTPDILNSAVTPAKIQSGTANQVLVTNGAGTNAVWIDQSGLADGSPTNETITAVGLAATNQLSITEASTTHTQSLNGLTLTGDVTGTINATTVGKIQGRDVTNTAPNVGDALVWNGTAWAPAVVTVSPTSQYYAVDPSSFQGLQPAGNNQAVTGLYEDNDGVYVVAHGNAREIMAPVNLPHGATIQSVTVYYQYTTLIGLGAITVDFERKTLGAATNETLTTTSPLLSLGISSANLPAISPAADRVIDNSTYSYRVRVTFPHLGTVDEPGEAAQRLYGLRIQYLK